MKLNLILATLLLTNTVLARTYTLDRKNDDYQSCVKNDEYFRFKIENTKFGIYSSKISGYAKNYQIQTTLKDNKFTNSKLVFKVKDLDTDDSERNQKLWEYCLLASKHPLIEINVKETLVPGINSHSGTITIRGKTHPIVMNIDINKNTKQNKYIIKGNATTGFQTLEIPDPSISIAKVSDEIWIDFALEFPILISTK